MRSTNILNNKIHSDLINKYWLLFQKLIIHIQLFNGKIDPPSEYDEVDEEVIYSQESPNMEVEDQVPRNWVYCQRYPFIPIMEETILSRIYVSREEHNFSRGQSSNIPHDARASVPNTDGQLRNILPNMESNDLDDQVRNTQSDVEPIDIEYLLEASQTGYICLR